MGRGGAVERGMRHGVLQEGEGNGGDQGKEEGGGMALVTGSGVRWRNRRFRRGRSQKRVIGSGN